MGLPLGARSCLEAQSVVHSPSGWRRGSWNGDRFILPQGSGTEDGSGPSCGFCRGVVAGDPHNCVFA